ncbi:MAG: UDP-N-acetylmuramoyl-tripeptide--D-alanyl-D-alanine ligase [Erysipelotrichaceae bacterium]
MKQSVSTIQTWLELENVGAPIADQIVTHVSLDSRTIQPNGLYIPLKGAHTDGHRYIEQAIQNGAIATLWQKGVDVPPLDIPILLCDNVQIELQRLAYLYRMQLDATFIGITGSNGKTSAKDLLEGMLCTAGKTQKTQGNYNNELGVPLTLLSFDEDVDYAIVEMGMEHAGEIAFLSQMVKPDYAIITNIGNAHLENLGTMENIALAKLEILEGMEAGATLFVNGDDPVLMDALAQVDHDGVQLVPFGKNSGHPIYYEHFTSTLHSIRFDTPMYPNLELPILGEHQAMNALAPLAIAFGQGVSAAQLQAGLAQVTLTKNRNELVQVGQCMLLNDVYKSNPESALAALTLFDSFPFSPRIAVLADMLDLGETSVSLHEGVGQAMAHMQIDVLYTYGEMAKYIAQGAQGSVATIQSFENKADLIAALLPWVSQPCAILIKGSRSMKLEEVVEAMKEEGLKHE